jgi:hypothetical protein
VTKNFTLSSALVMTDIGHTSFTGGTADPILSDLTFGLGASFQLRKAKVSLAWDQKHLLEDTEFRIRNRLGVEFSLPFIAIYGGYYQLALTYGASFDLWLFRFTASSYAEELATYANQNPSRRYALHIAMKFGF